MAKAKTTPAVTTTITLQQPLQRGDTEITTIELRRPSAGEMRGCQLMTLLAGDTDQVMRVASRITTPALQQHELQQMNVTDFFQISQEVTGFLVGSEMAS
ncbi:phage tail assembly protein [Zymobacter palmae]|uniref:Small-conductance mechanosensitive channel n=1 Tax=Zymobacter palmae TaxID=33074 RepID=A0A348HI85_9GAMM|nr:phage tail assembly protein [Zymobacter palmae]BBG31337.1 small-conductance mechanosensitive channel [Zymobacter palmae]